MRGFSQQVVDLSVTGRCYEFHYPAIVPRRNLAGGCVYHPWWMGSVSEVVSASR
jgi:hypothetical protein